MIVNCLCYARGMNKKSGFTVVELAVVIIVVSLLVVGSIFAWVAWNDSSLRSEVQAELTLASTAMDQQRNFENGYPLGMPADYKQGKGVVVTYKNGTTSSYCLEGQSRSDNSIRYKSVSGEISEGLC